MSRIAAARALQHPRETPVDRVIGDNHRSNKVFVSNGGDSRVRYDFSGDGFSETPPAKLSGTTSHTLTEPHWPQQRDRVGRGLVSNLPPFPHACLHSRWQPCQRHSQPTMSITQAGRADGARRNKIWGRCKRIFVKGPNIGVRASDARGWSQ